MKWYQLLILILILITALALRVYKTEETPPSLNWDEVSIAYNAYSVLKTGKDEWGNFLPVHFKAYGEYKLPVQIYASIPAIALIGLNDIAVRTTPVIYGVLTVLVLFFLTRKLLKDNLAALISAFFLAVSPWHIQLTRASFESSFAVFWIVLGIWLLVKGLSERRWLIISMIPLSISVYTYNSARVFVPLFLMVLLWNKKGDLLKHKKELILAAILFGVLMTPLVPFTLSQDRNSRYKLVSITDDPGLIPRINEQRNLSNLPDPFPRLIHNRATYISYYFLRNYFAHFTPDFLFISGAPHKQHHVQKIGQMYLLQLPLLFIGLYYLLKDHHRHRTLLSCWILLGIIPVSVTNDSIPHALRTLITLPAFLIICGVGGAVFARGLKRGRHLFFGIICVAGLLLFSLYLYLQNLFTTYPKLYSRDWQYGYQEMVQYIKENYSKYDQIVFTRHYGEPHMFTLFYLQYDPKMYQQNSNLIRFETHDWVRVLRFDKFFFPDLGDLGTTYSDIIQEYPNQRLLFIGTENDFPPELPVLRMVKFLDGSVAFKIVESP